MTIGFCMDCISDYYIDNTITDKDGNPRKVKFKKMTYLDLAKTFVKSSPKDVKINAFLFLIRNCFS